MFVSGLYCSTVSIIIDISDISLLNLKGSCHTRSLCSRERGAEQIDIECCGKIFRRTFILLIKLFAHFGISSPVGSPTQ